MDGNTNTKWAELLRKAVAEPGVVSRAYASFHDYSIGNQMLAAAQCDARGIPLGPISTYPGWQAKGRHVKKGEKAITLCMPITVKKKGENEDEEGERFTWFAYKPHWFVLAQTEGQELQPPALPEWDKTRALATLGITEEPFSMADGNTMGYARKNSIAVSPLAFNPAKTLMHEAAHVLLHTGDRTETERLGHSLEEVEAEAVALLVCEALGLGELAECRGYIQNWLHGGEAIPEHSAQRIFGAADRILKAGRPTQKQAAA